MFLNKTNVMAVFNFTRPGKPTSAPSLRMPAVPGITQTALATKTKLSHRNPLATAHATEGFTKAPAPEVYASFKISEHAVLEFFFGAGLDHAILERWRSSDKKCAAVGGCMFCVMIFCKQAVQTNWVVGLLKSIIWLYSAISLGDSGSKHSRQCFSPNSMRTECLNSCFVPSSISCCQRRRMFVFNMICHHKSTIQTGPARMPLDRAGHPRLFLPTTVTECTAKSSAALAPRVCNTRSPGRTFWARNRPIQSWSTPPARTSIESRPCVVAAYSSFTSLPSCSWTSSNDTAFTRPSKARSASLDLATAGKYHGNLFSGSNS